MRHLRHPVLIAMALWTGLHLLPNGDLAHVLLFGTLGAFAMAERSLIDKRRRREMRAEAWAALWRAPRAAPLRSWGGIAIRLLAAVAIYGALAVLHPVAIGVPVG